ncbi:MAG TPA: hypothetical protein VGZ47_00325 [Gemmataceae bacterium]|jgi:hypothetical protein|nr:hypothetical protein [Gemmataceae bacterium]
MTQAELKDRCDDLAARIDRAIADLQELVPDLPLRADERSADEAILNLTWARDTCTMLGLHAVKQVE